MLSNTKLLMLCLALYGCGADQQRSGSEPRAVDDVPDIAYVRLPAALLTPDFVRDTAFNRDHVRDAEFAFGYVERRVLDALPRELLEEVVELDDQAFARQALDPRTLLPIDEKTPELSSTSFEDYHNYEALTDELQRLAQDHPDIVHLESAGRSVQGRELWLLKISDNAALDEDEPKLLYIANMHGDEVVGRELMLYLSRLLTSEYGKTPRIKRLVDNSQIYVMPSMNPDGFEARRRYNGRGVDLNRDFPDFTSDPYDTPAGRAPETQAVMTLHARHHFVLAVNFHGGEVCFNMPWDTKSNTPREERFGDDPLMNALARQYSDLNPTMRSNSGGSFDRGVTYGYEWYEVDGGMQDWAIHYRQSTHATVELSMSKWPNASGLPTFWNENKEPLLQYLERGIFGVHLRVTDQAGGAIDNPIVRVSSTSRDVPYSRSTLTRPTLAGPQTVTVSAPGYQSRSLQLLPRAFDGTFDDLQLLR
jgi:carboxypeptidase D